MEYWTVLALAAIPGRGNFAGGLLAEAVEISWRRLSLAPHAAAGIVLAVVGVELMPRALEAGVPWVPIAAFVLGGAVFVGIDQWIDVIRARRGAGGSGAAWGIFFAVAVDLFSDGVMIGTGSVISGACGTKQRSGNSRFSHSRPAS